MKRRVTIQNSTQNFQKTSVGFGNLYAIDW